MSASKVALVQAAYEAAMVGIRERSAALVGPSAAEELAALPEDLRDELLAQLAPSEFASLLYEPAFWLRPKQRTPPGDWRWWLFMGGRGIGKSRTGSEFVKSQVEQGAGAIGILGPTYRHVAHFMLGGRKGRRGNGSGLLDVWPEHQRPRWWKTDGIVEFHNGAVGYVFTGEDEEIRGPNLDGAWVDEPIKIRGIDELFQNLELTMRADDVTPRGIITTTGKPIQWLKETIAREDVFVTLGKTAENKSNQDATWLRTIDRRLGGSRLERQELGGEIVEDDEGALFRQADIDGNRVAKHPPLVRVLVCLDPSTGDTKRADDAGIVGVGIDAPGEIYVLDDRSGKLSPEEQGDAAVAMFLALRANAFLVEDNKIGQHAASNVRAAMYRRRGEMAAIAMPIEEIHALGEKATRADPVSTLYRKGIVHHVGQLPELEGEITTWAPGKRSPGRLDALVHGVTKLAALEEDPPPPAEDPAMAHAASRWVAGGAAAGQTLAMTGEQYEAEQDADERGGTFGGIR